MRNVFAKGHEGKFYTGITIPSARCHSMYQEISTDANRIELNCCSYYIVIIIIIIIIIIIS